MWALLTPVDTRGNLGAGSPILLTPAEAVSKQLRECRQQAFRPAIVDGLLTGKPGQIVSGTAAVEYWATACMADCSKSWAALARMARASTDSDPKFCACGDHCFLTFGFWLSS